MNCKICFLFDGSYDMTVYVTNEKGVESNAEGIQLCKRGMLGIDELRVQTMWFQCLIFLNVVGLKQALGSLSSA